MPTCIPFVMILIALIVAYKQLLVQGIDEYTLCSRKTQLKSLTPALHTDLLTERYLLEWFRLRGDFLEAELKLKRHAKSDNYDISR